MQVYIRNNWITIGGSSTVKDLNEKELYRIKGKIFSFTRKKEVNTLDGKLLYLVRNKFWSFFVKKAYVYDDKGTQVAFIKRKFFSVHDRYFMDTKLGQIEIVGNIFLFNYKILLGGKEIGHVARKVSLRDSFVLTIDDSYELPFFIALVIAIDNITDRRREENNS